MHFRAVFHVVSLLLGMIALALAATWGAAHLLGDPPAARAALGLSAALTAGGATALWFLTLGPMELTRRDGFGVVSFGWLAVSLFGSLPYLLSGTCAGTVDALFETVSGFTTTGASVLTDLETIPRGILLWRALTQWLGGMGVLVLCVAILPFLGVGGMQIFQAEMPGPSVDRLTPRIASTAKLLWSVYVLLTLLQALLLSLGPMDMFDAICHAFTTMSTGGFSTRTASVQAYGSLYSEVVITIFMLLAGINFVLHFRALSGRPSAWWKDSECRFFVVLWFGLVATITLNLWITNGTYSMGDAVRVSAFQVSSILTTTGYCTADFNLWHPLARFLLVGMMFTGACAGSTSGGLKLVRVLILWRKIVRDIRRFIRPQAVYNIKMGERMLDPDIIVQVTGFALTFFAVFVGGTLLLCLWSPDLTTAATSIAATLGNIGPGLGAVGPTETFLWVPAPGKLVLILCMLLGRLELYTLLVLFLPSFWRR